MFIHEQRCVSLGIEEREPYEKDGKPQKGFTRLNFVAFEEKSSRQAYLNDATIKSQALKYCSNWGAEFLVSGSISDKGVFTLDSIEPVADNSLGLI